MSDRAQIPDSNGDNLILEPDVLDDAREAALAQAVVRAQEQHREGGPGPEPQSGAENSDT